MKIINCVLADDEELAQGIIERYISQLPQLRLVASCTNGAETFTALKNNKVDLLFLDIKMPQLSGLELLRSVKKSATGDINNRLSRIRPRKLRA